MCIRVWSFRILAVVSSAQLLCESAYQLSDEFYRYAARRDIGLPPTTDTVLPHRCGACQIGVAADGLHRQRCVYNAAFAKLRHDSIEQLLHSIIIGGVGRAYRQPSNLHAVDSVHQSARQHPAYLPIDSTLLSVCVSRMLPTVGSATPSRLHSSIDSTQPNGQSRQVAQVESFAYTTLLVVIAFSCAIVTIFFSRAILTRLRFCSGGRRPTRTYQMVTVQLVYTKAQLNVI